VAAKRIVLPITTVVFSALWLDGFRRATAPSIQLMLLVGAALIVNGFWVLHAIRYCEACGRTFQHSTSGVTTCSSCSDESE
jgi:hypothetical protein